MDLILSLILHKTATLPQQHYHSNTTTATLPQQHYHSNTTTATLPQQHYHSNTTTATLPQQHCHRAYIESSLLLHLVRIAHFPHGSAMDLHQVWEVLHQTKVLLQHIQGWQHIILGLGDGRGGMEGVEGCTLYYNEHSSLTEEEETV